MPAIVAGAGGKHHTCSYDLTHHYSIMSKVLRDSSRPTEADSNPLHLCIRHDMHRSCGGMRKLQGRQSRRTFVGF